MKNIDLFSKTIRKLRDLGKNKKGVFVCNLNLKKSFNVGDEVDYNYDFENKVLTVIKNQNDTQKIASEKVRMKNFTVSSLIVKLQRFMD